jgi:hypothetical protein
MKKIFYYLSIAGFLFAIYISILIWEKFRFLDNSLQGIDSKSVQQKNDSVINEINKVRKELEENKVQK